MKEKFRFKLGNVKFEPFYNYVSANVTVYKEGEIILQDTIICPLGGLRPIKKIDVKEIEELFTERIMEKLRLAEIIKKLEGREVIVEEKISQEGVQEG